jgi:protein-S-isoprenylcysteine O-methyltransferase Ste14
MWGVAQISPRLEIARAMRIPTACLFFVLGVAVSLSAVIAFRRAQTTVNPNKPERASSLVNFGVYRFTRNPMYFSLTSLLVGLTILLAAPVALFGPVLFVWFTTRFQIIPEERALTAKFGTEFTQYQSSVRRWI